MIISDTRNWTQILLLRNHTSIPLSQKQTNSLPPEMTIRWWSAPIRTDRPSRNGTESRWRDIDTTRDPRWCWRNLARVRRWSISHRAPNSRGTRSPAIKQKRTTRVITFTAVIEVGNLQRTPSGYEERHQSLTCLNTTVFEMYKDTQTISRQCHLDRVMQCCICVSDETTPCTDNVAEPTKATINLMNLCPRFHGYIWWGYAPRRDACSGWALCSDQVSYNYSIGIHLGSRILHNQQLYSTTILHQCTLKIARGFTEIQLSWILHSVNPSD